jgi:hypothetical protein
MVANFEKLSSLRQRNTDEHNDGNDDPSEMLVASRDIANVDKFNCDGIQTIGDRVQERGGTIRKRIHECEGMRG